MKRFFVGWIALSILGFLSMVAWGQECKVGIVVGQNVDLIQSQTPKVSIKTGQVIARLSSPTTSTRESFPIFMVSDVSCLKVSGLELYRLEDLKVSYSFKQRQKNLKGIPLHPISKIKFVPTESLKTGNYLLVMGTTEGVYVFGVK